MKLVLAFDSFKGSLDAADACRAAADAIRAAIPGCEIALCPMADGGEGTAAALLAARGGEWIPQPATGPLPALIVDAGFAWLPFDETVVVETASAAGLTLLHPGERDPMRTATTGVGELIAAAARRNPRRILLGAGGSATIDGGMGMARALGWRFLDDAGHELAPCGASLGRVARAIPPSHLELPHIAVLVDVDNPLCGAEGAARTFGSQKGASPDDIAALDASLGHFAARILDATGRDMRALRGGGAAGGLAAGAACMLGASLVPGIDTVMDAAGFDDVLAGADWVLTGEGAFDWQSLRGKVVSGVVRRARDRGAKTAVLAGRIDLQPGEWSAMGIATAIEISPGGAPAHDAMQHARENLAAAARRFALDVLIG